jgi:murein DD-endopeptidase MepM/ murein hydrolase activator NlpD
VVTYQNYGNDVTNTMAHLSSVAPGIAPGVQVLAGQLIGFSGNTGNVIHHLHHEAMAGGVYVDPTGCWR